ncbi:MAG TPA: TCP-1/cpn60 chaperonin family protein [Roseiflexaceae bacterium]|nr:TCP-1/cpn60 chaperonin family protein [Roseiflexaceae bacterium]
MRRRRRDTTFKQVPRTPSVTFQPDAYQGFQRGINLLANAVRPTLGPLPRAVAVEPVAPGDKRPELLDDAGVIARRFLQARDRDADTGAMFLRHVLWRQHERAGDGTATTAVLFQSVYNQGVTYIAAGGNPMRLRAALERGLRAILEAHEAQATPLHGRAQIQQVAAALCQDEPLAELLAEALDTVSEHGAVEVRSGRGRALERQYVIGSYYRGRPLSEWMLAGEPGRRAELHDAAVLVSDLSLNEPSDVAPLLRLVDAAGISNLLLIAREATEPVIAALLAAGRAPQPCRILAVKAPDAVTGQAAMLDDLAVLTGGRALLRAAGDTLRTLRPEDLGHTRRAWSDEEFFGVVSGKGAPRALSAHLCALRAAHAHTEDEGARKKLRERIGKLLGGTAVLWIGDISEIAITARKELAARTLEALRATIGRGVVPGGGVSLLACRAPLHQLAEQTADLDERTAYRILARALEEPTRTILRNAGYEAGPWMDAIARAGPRHGFDVRSGQVVDMAAAGIIDSAGVLRSALHAAVASAALALTVDVLVHTRLPELAFEP